MTLIAGDGELRETLEEKCKTLNLKNVVFLGNQPQTILNQIYNIANCSIVPSRREPFGLVAAEAMLCGAALACTDIGGFALYARDNETALVSQVFDVDWLAENIKKLIQDDTLRMKIAKAGNTYILQFTWDNAYEKFKRVLLDE